MDPQEKIKALIESGRRHQQPGETSFIIAMALLSLMLLYSAWDVYRKGLRISKAKTVTGPVARLLAVFLVVLAAGVVAMGLWYWPGILR